MPSENPPYRYDNALGSIFQKARGFIFDLDGTLYLGEHLIEGADRVLSGLRRSGRKVAFVSNKPIARRGVYAAKLRRLGIPCEESEVINSSLVLARYLAAHFPKARILPIAEQPVIDDILRHGLRITDDPDAAAVVVVSWDRGFNYEKLLAAYRAAANGAALIGTNPDRTCPMPDGDLPDAACMIAAIEACTQRQVHPIVGKPSSIMLREALALIDLSAEECVMVGDRVETDILMADRAGLLSVLVLSGVTKEEDLPHITTVPDAIVGGVRDLLPFLAEASGP